MSRNNKIDASERIMEIGGVPLYIRLANVFRDNISTRKWQAGEQIPTIPELCAQYNVARITVRRALAELADSGLLTSTRGRGTFVEAPHQNQQAAEHLRSTINDPLQTAPLETMRVLLRRKVTTLPEELKSSHPQYPGYMRIRKVHSLHGMPFQVVDTYVAETVYARFPKGADRHSKTARLLRDHGGVHISSYCQELTIAYADMEIAELLQCPVGSVLVRVRRWRYDDRQRTVYAAVNLYRGDRFVLEIETPTPSNLDFVSGIVPAERKPEAER